MLPIAAPLAIFRAHRGRVDAADDVDERPPRDRRARLVLESEHAAALCAGHAHESGSIASDTGLADGLLARGAGSDGVDPIVIEAMHDARIADLAGEHNSAPECHARAIASPFLSPSCFSFLWRFVRSIPSMSAVLVTFQCVSSSFRKM